MNKLTFNDVLRMAFIETILANHGRVYRGDLMDYFGMSSASSTRTLARYHALYPHNVEYDSSSAGWVRADTFRKELV